MKFKQLLACAMLAAFAAPSMAENFNLGPLSIPSTTHFGNSFNIGDLGNFTDNFSFSIPSGANSSGEVDEYETNFDFLNLVGIDVNSVSLSGAGGLIGMDTSPGQFSFGGLAAGNYTLTVAGRVFLDQVIGLPLGASYDGEISLRRNNDVPEPGTLALLGLGLVGLGMARRRRAAQG